MIIHIPTPFAKQIQAIKTYFYRPIVIYSTDLPTGILIKAWTTPSGDKYARVKYTRDRKTKHDSIGITDIPAAKIIKAIKGTSPFIRDWEKAKAKAKFKN